MPVCITLFILLQDLWIPQELQSADEVNRPIDRWRAGQRELFPRLQKFDRAICKRIDVLQEVDFVADHQSKSVFQD